MEPFNTDTEYPKFFASNLNPVSLQFLQCCLLALLAAFDSGWKSSNFWDVFEFASYLPSL